MEKKQEIFREYVGQFSELTELKAWFIEFHKLVFMISTNPNNSSEITMLLNKLEIRYTYKQGKFSTISFDYNLLNTIYKDFITQFHYITDTNYKNNFIDIENDKLLLFNIIERYFLKIKRTKANKVPKTFQKASKNRILQLIPKNKNSKLFNYLNSEFLWVFMLLYFLIILTLFLTYVIHYSLIEILKLGWGFGIMNFLISLMGENTFENVLFSFVIIIDFAFAFILAFTFALKTQRFWERFMPEREVTFARNLEEKKNYHTFVSLIMSLIAILLTISSFLI